MTNHQVYIGEYRKSIKKEGPLFVFDLKSKALIECICVSIVVLLWRMIARTRDVDAHFCCSQMSVIVFNLTFSFRACSYPFQTIAGDRLFIKSSTNEIEIDKDISLKVRTDLLRNEQCSVFKTVKEPLLKKYGILIEIHVVFVIVEFLVG